MKKIILSFLLIFLTTTNIVYADATTTEDTATTTAESESQGTATSTEDSSLEGDTATSFDETAIDEVKFYIKNGSEIIFEGNVEINNEEIDVADNSGTSHLISRDNVLGALTKADLDSENFEITDLQYNSSFDSFIINCIEYSNKDICDNWRYVVNDQYPNVGVDAYFLEDGDEIYLYFGQPRKLILPNKAFTDLEFEVKAKEYDYVNDSWSNLSDYTVGVFLDDPENPWTPNVIATSEIYSGAARFTISEKGTYKLGLEEDYFYPFYELEIASSSNSDIQSSTSTDENDLSDGGDNDGSGAENDNGESSSGGSVNNSSNQFHIDEAVDFLLEVQNKDGSFGASLYSDWAGIAFSAVNESNNSLKNYIKNSSTNSDIYEKIRKSMALLSFDLNPAEDYEEDLIKKIVDEFDGTQFGDVDLFNDDIFALIVLQNVGYDKGDREISKTIEFILEKQSSSGAWEGIDLTAAAIQSLIEFESLPDVPDAISKAEEYLESKQNSDGSWGDVYATSWAIMAMTSLGYNFDDWKGNPLEYLGNYQDVDGGLLKDDTNNNRVWSTSYAIAAVSEKTWIEILNDFPKRNYFDDSENNENNNSSDSVSSSNSNNSSDAENDGNLILTSDLEDDSTITERFIDNLDKILPYLEQNELSASEVLISNTDNGIEFVQTDKDIKEYLEETSNNFKEDEGRSNEERSEINIENKNQAAAIINSINLNEWTYLLLGLLALGISVIMFKIK